MESWRWINCHLEVDSLQYPVVQEEIFVGVMEIDDKVKLQSHFGGTNWEHLFRLVVGRSGGEKFEFAGKLITTPGVDKVSLPYEDDVLVPVQQQEQQLASGPPTTGHSREIIDGEATDPSLIGKQHSHQSWAIRNTRSVIEY